MHLWSNSLVNALGLLRATIPTLVLMSSTALAQTPPPRFGGQQPGPQQVMQAVAQFGCQPGAVCEIDCWGAGGPRKFTLTLGAVVYRYPNSNHLWLGTDARNDHYLLGDDAFCDFSKALKVPATPPVNPMPK